jgi:hypothetical protein
MVFCNAGDTFVIDRTVPAMNMNHIGLVSCVDAIFK